MIKLSKKFNSFLMALSSDVEYLKVNYYMRSLKKAPHGGVFNIRHQSFFLRYYKVGIYTFLLKGRELPYPIEQYKKKVEKMINDFDISIEEFLEFCFCNNIECDKVPHMECFYGDKHYSALCGGALSIPNVDGDYFQNVVDQAVLGKVKFLDYFDYDLSRLIEIFLLLCVKMGIGTFSRVEDICNLEQLGENKDKYGLSDIACADFKRQGFVVGNEFFLYNVFFDTSIGSPNACVPKTIEIIKKYSNGGISIYMRKDKILSVPFDKKVESASTDLQKWRGITLNLETFESPIKSDKEVIVHYCPETGHKVVVVIKKSISQSNENYYHVTVEELWSPKSIYKNEVVVLTNFVHGCYYPQSKSFDHLDFSVNQYDKDVFLKKYADAFPQTAVPIEKYADAHYKVWCIRGKGISLNMWAELVICTLDAPFRDIFVETIGVKVEEFS